MVNKLSELAAFLEDQSIPAWVKDGLREHYDDIRQSLEQGLPYTLTGPDGAKITIARREAAAAAS